MLRQPKINELLKRKNDYSSNLEEPISKHHKVDHGNCNTTSTEQLILIPDKKGASGYWHVNFNKTMNNGEPADRDLVSDQDEIDRIPSGKPVGGIYYARNKVDGKGYVGESCDLKRRKSQHFNLSQHFCTYFHNAIMKHGKESFEFKILATFPSEWWGKDHPMKPAIFLAEKDFIYEMKTWRDREDGKGWGYNLQEGSATGNGRHSEESKKKISQSLKENFIAKNGREGSVRTMKFTSGRITYVCCLMIDRKQKHMGCFDSYELAIEKIDAVVAANYDVNAGPQGNRMGKDFLSFVLPGLKWYKAEFGDLLVPSIFVVPDHAEPEAIRGLTLGDTVHTIRKEGGGASYANRHRAELDAIGFVWNVRDYEFFNRVLPGLKWYKAEFGDLLVPSIFEVPDDAEPEAIRGLTLGTTVQRIRDGSSYADRRAELDAIGFVWKVRDYEFLNRVLPGLQWYKADRGDLLVKKRFVVPDDAEPEAIRGLTLGATVKNIRKGAYADRKPQLDAVGFVWKTGSGR